MCQLDHERLQLRRVRSSALLCLAAATRGCPAPQIITQHPFLFSEIRCRRRLLAVPCTGECGEGSAEDGTSWRLNGPQLMTTFLFYLSMLLHSDVEKDVAEMEAQWRELLAVF